MRNTIILKTPEDRKIFLEAILNPPAPNEALKKAALNYLKFKTKQPSDVHPNGNHQAAP